MNTRTSVLTTTFLVGLACAGYAFYHLYHNWKLTENGVRTTASVFYLDMRVDRIRASSFKHYRVDDYSDECFKTVVYYTKGGERIIWQSRVSTDLPDWLRGDHVYEERAATILYSPEDPYYWEFEKPLTLFVNWFVLLLAGLGLMSLSFGPYDAVMRRLRDSDEDRERALASIREELYTAREPARSSAPAKDTETIDTRVRTAPPGVDPDAPLVDEATTFGPGDVDREREPAYASYGEANHDAGDSSRDGFGEDTDPFTEI
ncbi:MAG TPA: hypothetical protein P5081_17755 [Phycisphaerae bacterium]|nr:hypothetical protein [Phycisphaerae bacterium]HRW54717.1 hypothetical protein [Phycisphaerae bacterium]